MASKIHIGPTVVLTYALPLLFATGLAFGIPYLSRELLGLAGRFVSLPPRGSWQWLYLHHGAQLGLALIGIAVVRRYVPADYGLHLPRGKTYIGAAHVGGLSFALVASAVAYGPLLIAHRAPTLSYAPTTANVVG